MVQTVVLDSMHPWFDFDRLVEVIVFYASREFQLFI